MDRVAVGIVIALALASCGDNLAVGADAQSMVDAWPYRCTGTTGLVAPLEPAMPFTMPDCQTNASDHPAFDDNPPRTWIDAVSGDPRAACVFRPGGTGDRPLVMFFHGASLTNTVSAGAIYDLTLLRAKAASFDLENDPSRLGYVLVADQGRWLDNPNSLGGGPALRRDIYYRDLGSPSTNPDFRNADRLIDELVAEGGIDPARIYVIGWSNGGLFAGEYGIARHAIATPGGHRVAAVATYAGPDPFENTSATQVPSCAYSPLPTTDAPIDVVHRDCDVSAACDAAQQARFQLPPGYDLETWISTLKTRMSDPDVVDTLLDANAALATGCASTCDMMMGALNHAHWPDGINDGSGIDRELDMLAFFRDHPGT
jgi:hypothetical protein